MKTDRPKLLFLAWNFPPAQAIGSVRTWNIAKHLSRLGWAVTVVTPDRKLMRRLENSEKANADQLRDGIQCIPTGHYLRFLAPNHLQSWDSGAGWLLSGISRKVIGRLGISRAIGWIKAAERACNKLTAQEVDLIFASGPPFSAFVLAERLSKKLGRPYVLDYRDPWWTEIPGMFRVLRPLPKRLEARLLAGAAAITIVSPSWAADLGAEFKIGSKIHVITNGYDPEDLADVKPHNFGHFAIVYAGIFYPPERVVTPVLQALKRLADTGHSGEWFFHYYGENDVHVREEADRLGVSDHVQLHGRVPRSEALAAMKGANISVVIASVFGEASAGIQGWIPAKIFELIGLGAPILLIAPPTSDIVSIAEATGLARRFSGDDIKGITSFLEHETSELRARQREVDSVTWTSLAGSLDRVLRQQVRRFQRAEHSSPTKNNPIAVRGRS